MVRFLRSPSLLKPSRCRAISHDGSTLLLSRLANLGMFGTAVVRCGLAWWTAHSRARHCCAKRGRRETDESRKKLVIDRELLSALQAWKRTTQFSKSSDWVFASPVQLWRLPWSYHYVRRIYRQAAKDAGIGEIGTHSMRHTYRSWLDSQGTPLGVQQKPMRHVNIATTVSYGDAFSADMAEAHSKIVGLALNGLPTDRIAS